MKVPFHSAVETQFFEYLLKRGYPRDAITFEPYLGERLRPDFAITDPVLDQRLAYIEVKNRLMPNGMHQAFKQLKTYASAAKAVGASAYLAIPSEKPTIEEPFDFYYVDKNDSVKLLPTELLPTYHSLLSDVVATRKAQIETSQEQTKDYFRITCWILAAVVFILIVVDFVCNLNAIEVMNATRLIMLGISVALIVIPYAQKLKILGIEYERYVQKSKNSSIESYKRVDMDAENCDYDAMEFTTSNQNANLRDSGRKKGPL